MSLNKKIDKMLNNMMHNDDNTVQKLPLINQKNQNDNSDDINDNKSQVKSGIMTSINQNQLQYQKIQGTYLGDPRLKPIGANLYQKSKLFRCSNVQNRKKIQSANFIPPAHKPLQIPQFDESDIKKNGLLDLINRGVIPKSGVDLTSLIEKGTKPFINKKVQIRDNFHEQFLRKNQIAVNNENSAQFFVIDQGEKSKASNFSESKSLLKGGTNKFSKMRLFGNDFFQPQEDLKNPIYFKPDQLSTEQLLSYQESQNSLRFQNHDPRTYNEVLDQFSLHQFIIRKGKTLEETPEFISYQRIFQSNWQRILNIIKSLEKLLTEYDIKLANIDGKKVAALASKQALPTLEELVDCIINQSDLIEKIKIPKIMFKGPDGINKAAIKIQSFWRMFLAMRDYQRIRTLIQKVKIIQQSVRIYLFHKRTKEHIKDQKQECLEHFKDMQTQFKYEWPQIKQKRRIEIHINSFNYDELKRLSMEKYHQRQNIQITRIFKLKDPLVDIIYIAPFDISSEVISYYHKVLEIGGVKDYQNRLWFVWPENHDNFPSHFTTSRLLLYSPKTMKRIKQLIKGKISYIVPGNPSNDDIILANELNVPIFSGDPQKHLILSTKSSSIRFLTKLDVPTPPGWQEIYDEKEFYTSLTLLIINNPQIDLWLFKIDDEFNGRGIAYFQVSSIKKLDKIRQNIISQQQELDERLTNMIREIVQQKLPLKIKIASNSLFKNFREYMMQYVRKGGIIQASPNVLNRQIQSPSVFFQIEPDGQINILGCYDKISGKDYQNFGCIYPKQSLKQLNIYSLCQTIGEELYKKQNIFGYMTLDLIAFAEPQRLRSSIQKQESNLFWAIGIDTYLNNYNSSFFYFDFLIKGKIDRMTGNYYINVKQYEDKLQQLQLSHDNKLSQYQLQNLNNDKRMFLYCPFLNHEGLQNVQFKTFFHMCRVEGISYDIERKAGSTFLLADSLQTGVLGAMTIAQNYEDLIKLMKETLQFIVKQAGNLQLEINDVNSISRCDKLNLQDIMSRIKLLYKNLEREKQNNSKQKIISHMNSAITI